MTDQQKQQVIAWAQSIGWTYLTNQEVFYKVKNGELLDELPVGLMAEFYNATIDACIQEINNAYAYPIPNIGALTRELKKLKAMKVEL